MSGIFSKVFRGSALISFVFLFSACSEQATCALEGCTQENSVNLEGDAQASEDASPASVLEQAKAEIEKAKKEITDAFNELKDRVIFNDSVDKLQNDMLSLHEQRIQALELKVKDLEPKVAQLQADLSTLDNLIRGNNNLLDQLKMELLATITEGSESSIKDLEQRISALETNTSDLGTIRSNISTLLGYGHLTVQEVNDILANDVTHGEDIAELMALMYGDEDLEQEGVLARLDMLTGAVETHAGYFQQALQIARNLQAQLASVGITVDDEGNVSLNGQALALLQDIQSIDGLAAQLQQVRDALGMQDDGISDVLDALQDEVAGITRCSISARYRSSFLLPYKQDITCVSQTETRTITLTVGY